MASLRMNQFFESHSKLDRFSIFEEAVLSLSENDELGAPVSLKRKSQKKIVDQIETLFNQAFTHICTFGSPDDAKELAHSYTLIQMYRRFVLQEQSNISGPSCYLEYPRFIFSSRGGLKNMSPVLSKRLLPNIPSNIVVCSIDYDSIRELLYISRITSDRRYLFKLPLRRLAIRDGEVNGPGLSYDVAMEEFNDIMHTNKDTTTNAKFCSSNQEKSDWLKKRISLDTRLRDLLGKIEDEWLAGFKGILRTYECDSSSLIQFKDRLEKLIGQNLARHFNSKKVQSSFSLPLCQILVGVGPKPSFEELEDILYYLLDGFQLHGISIEYDELSIEEVL
jgi:hypothetical protein